jgi:hypothetical protein
VFGKSSGGYGAITHALRHSDIWAAAACYSGDMGFELCYLPDMPAVLRALAGAENSIERWWQQLEAAKKHPEGSFKVINAMAMAASDDPVRHLRRHRGTLGELVAARPRRRDRNPGGQSPQAEGALHRLRREGPVQSALRCPQVRGAPFHKRNRRTRITHRESWISSATLRHTKLTCKSETQATPLFARFGWSAVKREHISR